MPRLHSRAQVTQPLASPALSRAPTGSAGNSRNPTRTSNGTTGTRYQPPTHLPLHATQLRALNSLAASYGSENSLLRRCIADALRVLGDAAGDLAELVPAVDFTGKETGEGDGGEEETGGRVEKKMKEEEKEEEEGVKKAGGDNEGGGKEGTRLLMEMEERAREMVDRAWEIATAGQVVRGEVVAHAQAEGIAEDSKDEPEIDGLWDVYDAAIEELNKQRAVKPMKVR